MVGPTAADPVDSGRRRLDPHCTPRGSLCCWVSGSTVPAPDGMLSVAGAELEGTRTSTHTAVLGDVATSTWGPLPSWETAVCFGIRRPLNPWGRETWTALCHPV